MEQSKLAKAIEETVREQGWDWSTMDWYPPETIATITIQALLQNVDTIFVGQDEFDEEVKDLCIKFSDLENLLDILYTNNPWTPSPSVV